MKTRWFFVLRKLVDHLFAGSFRSKKKGAGGVEFAAFREWQPGDPVRLLAHKESLKHSKFFVRDNVIEKGVICLFMLDRSDSTNYGKSGISKKKIQDRILNILAPAVAQGNNQSSFLVFTDRLEKYLPPRFGEKYIAERLKLIYEYRPKSRLTNIDFAFRQVFERNIPADLIFVISDFYTQYEFEDSLKILSKKYDVIPLLLKDPSETTTFPKVSGAMISFRDMETDELFWGEAPQKISNVGLFKKLGLDYVLLKTDETEQDWVKKLMIIFEQRKKRRAR